MTTDRFGDAEDLVHDAQPAGSGPLVAFTVLLRLADRMPDPGKNWERWDATGPGEELKVYPGGPEYFVPQIERVLFPEPGSAGNRWIRSDVGQLQLLSAATPVAVLSIELLEIVRFPLDPFVTFGIAHLSLVEPSDANRAVDCARILNTRYRNEDDPEPLYRLVGHDRTDAFGTDDPRRELAERLFGSAHLTAGRRGYICTVAWAPASIDESAKLPWARALGRGISLDRAQRILAQRPDRDQRRAEEIGPATLKTFALGAAFVHRKSHRETWLRNVRSYWSEAILFALAQHAYVEEFALDLARLGARPLSKEVNDLHASWLAFRNVLGWRHLAAMTDVPSRILTLVSRELGTPVLVAEIQSNLDSYVEERRRIAEEHEASALRDLQIYGAGFAAVSTAAAVFQVVGLNYLEGREWVAVVSLLAVGVLVIALTRWLLLRRTGHTD